MFADFQKLIEGCVDGYKKIYSEEYASFLAGQKVKHDNLLNKFAEIKDSDALVRGLVEIPETLVVLLRKHLTDEGFMYFDSLDGKKWFAKQFPEFRMGNKI